jgi:hypothetical protein
MRGRGLRALRHNFGIARLCSAEIIRFPNRRRRPRTRQAMSPDKLNAFGVIQVGRSSRGALGEVVEPRELAKHYHQLAEQCYRLAAIASEPAVAEGFMRMGEGLAVKAKDLGAKDLGAKDLGAKDGQGSQTVGRLF